MNSFWKTFSLISTKYFSGAEVKLFGRFQKDWENIEKSQYQTAWSEVGKRPILSKTRDDLRICTSNVNRHKISKWFSGTPRVSRCLARRNYSWLAFQETWGISSSKMNGSSHLFHKTIDVQLTNQVECLVCEISIFSVVVYTKPWLTSADAVSAPRTNLETLQLLRSYYDTNIGQVADRKLSKHLWYLLKEFVCLSIFDRHASAPTKRAMVTAMTKKKWWSG